MTVKPLIKIAYTIAEAAEVSSLGQTSIYKAIKERRLRVKKYGARTIVRRTDLAAFLRELPDANEKARD
jgi:excisionase family DNA binding protein